MNFEDYNNPLPYPSRPAKNSVNLASGIYKKEHDKYLNELDIYHKKDEELFDKFKKDALKEVGLLGHPKADKALKFAWEHGHSASYEEVYNWLVDVAELIL